MEKNNGFEALHWGGKTQGATETNGLLGARSFG